MSDDTQFDFSGLSDESNDVETDSYSSSSPTFAAQGHARDTYRDGHGKKASTTDGVDIRKLVRETSLSDLRWSYRNTFAKVLVDKPIDDAYKNGLDIKNDPSGKVDELHELWNGPHQLAEKKSRRDGMAVLFKVFNETGDIRPSDPPTRQSVDSLDGLNVWTVDDLADVSEGQIVDDVPDGYGRDTNGSYNYECRPSGLVISKKLNSTDWNDPIGVVHGTNDSSDTTNYQFVHADRCHFYTWNEEVDGDFHRDNNSVYTELRRGNHSTIGKWEGDSILQPCYHYIKDVFKGSWATMETVFRYSSPLYELQVPAKDAQSEEDYENVVNTFNNLNAQSEVFLPEGYELDMHDSDGNFNPEEYFSPIFDQICASTEMTRSVLFGTQSGTVSGSSTDRSNYVNQVERYQHNRGREKFREFVKSISMVDNSTIPNFALGYKLDWNPVFELDDLDKAENARTILNAVVQTANQYALTPNEVRDLLGEILSDLDYEIDLSEDLELEDFDFLADIELASNGQYTPMNLQAAQEMMKQGRGANNSEDPSMENPRSGQQTTRPPAQGTGEAQ